MFRLFESFLAKMKASLQRITKATKHDVPIEDLQQDAWIVAQEIGRRRGREIDFSDPEDQELVLKAVNLDNVKRGDWHLRKSVRIDHEPEDEGGIEWHELLPARASSDPLVSILLQESALDADEMLASSYSQAAAYVMVLVRFEYSREAICAYLVISDGALMRRVMNAADTVRAQYSLFDRVEQISEDFMPLPGRQYAVRAAQAGNATNGAGSFSGRRLAFVSMRRRPT
jgi:hypothetical protein